MLVINWSIRNDKDIKKTIYFFTMAAVTCLLLFLVLAINGLNWMMLESKSDVVLETLVEAEGVFQRVDFKPPPPFARPLNMDRMRASCFFVVWSDNNNNIVDVNIEQISAIDNEMAQKYALKVLSTGKNTGSWMDTNLR